MPTINISYNVPSENESEVEDSFKAHAEHMRLSYPADNPRGDKFIAAMQTYATVSVMGEIFYDMNE